MRHRTLVGRKASVMVVAGFALLATLLALPSPAEASFPGKNGKIAIVRAGGIYTINPDGSGLTPITTGAAEPAWSPDGTRLAFRRNDGIYTSNADGSGATRIATGSVAQPAWSPDGTELVYVKFGACDPDDGSCDPPRLIRVNQDGSEARVILPAYGLRPDWSPDGTEIVYDGCEGSCGGENRNIWVVNAAGGGVRQLSGGEIQVEPAWAPNAARIVYEDRSRNPASSGLEIRNRDGSGARLINGTVGWWRGVEGAPSWSPDGTLIATPNRYGPCDPNCRSCTPTCYFDLFLVHPDGTGVTRITDFRDVMDADWQPIPINSYARPKVATPLEVSLVPAYQPCTAPKRTHGPSLGSGSCSPPAQASDELTLGAPDVNGKPVRATGRVEYAAQPGDVRITVTLKDIHERQTPLTDYTGEVRVRAPLRITDKLNTPHPGGPGAATVSDASLGATVSCTSTADPNAGSDCNLLTTANTLVPGTVTAGKRAVWGLGQVQVDDGGADGDADTASDNTLFMVQGVFVP